MEIIQNELQKWPEIDQNCQVLSKNIRISNILAKVWAEIANKFAYLVAKLEEEVARNVSKFLNVTSLYGKNYQFYRRINDTKQELTKHEAT